MSDTEELLYPLDISEGNGGELEPTACKNISPKLCGTVFGLTCFAVVSSIVAGLVLAGQAARLFMTGSRLDRVKVVRFTLLPGKYHP